jgi:hypothetical protein
MIVVRKKSRGFEWDCWMSISCVFLTKKSLKIHSMKESIKINRLLNTNKHFKSVEKSQFNTNRFCYPEKKISIVLIEYHKIYLTFIKIFIKYHKTFLS